MKSLLGISFLFFLGACTTFAKPSKTNSKSVLSVKVTREEAKENCEAVSTVKGTYLGFKPNQRKLPWPESRACATAASIWAGVLAAGSAAKQDTALSPSKARIKSRLAEWRKLIFFPA